jgi:phosphate/sulfate permease
MFLATTTSAALLVHSSEHPSLCTICCNQCCRYGYTEGKVIKSVTAPAWVVLIGAVGLVFGLATYGYKASDKLQMQQTPCVYRQTVATCSRNQSMNE